MVEPEVLSKCLFANLTPQDMKSKLYVVIRIYRIGPLAMKEKEKRKKVEIIFSIVDFLLLLLFVVVRLRISSNVLPNKGKMATAHGRKKISSSCTTRSYTNQIRSFAHYVTMFSLR